MAIPELDLKKVNLQAAVGYLISLHDNEVDWNLLGIKVIGHIDALPIPEGTYEYGDAYMVGTEPPYDMYIYTRPDGTVHTEGYWFPIGKFPMPGPQGPKGDGVETFTSINTGTSQYTIYDTKNGINSTYAAKINYKDSTTGESKSQTVGLNAKTPILPGKYISIGNRDSRNVEIGVDDTALALDYIKIDKTIKNSAVPRCLNGAISWIQLKWNAAPYSIAYRDDNGNCNFNNVNLSTGFTINNANYSATRMNYLAQQDLVIADQVGGTLTTEETNYIKYYVVCRLIIDGKVYYRTSPIGTSSITTVRFMSCDSTGTISVLTCNTTNKTYTISQATYNTYKHVTQMHVVIPGDDDYYLTIFNTDNHGAMYNLNSASTLLDNIGTAGTMAYKQNTANGVYMPVHISKTSSGNWEWNMGSASGTFTTAQIDTITDDYEILG